MCFINIDTIYVSPPVLYPIVFAAKSALPKYPAIIKEILRIVYIQPLCVVLMHLGVYQQVEILNNFRNMVDQIVFSIFS